MPDVIDETDEERRKRLEAERAQLLGQLEQLQAAPDVAPPIKDAPAAPLIMPPERPDTTAVAPSSYDQEVARAKANSGFINAEVDPFGRVLQPMVTPAIQDAAMKAAAEERAARFSGQQQYASLLKGGATPEEAYRATAHLLNFNHPDKLASGLKAVGAPLSPGGPKIVTRNGETYYVKGNEYVHVPRVAKLDPESANMLKNADDEVKRQGALYDAVRKQYTANPPRNDRAREEQVLAEGRASKAYRSALEARNAVAARLNNTTTATMPEPIAPPRPPMQTADEPGRFVMSRNPDVIANAKPTTAPSSEKIVVVKDGKRFYLPKSQLEEAMKEGYKLGQ